MSLADNITCTRYRTVSRHGVIDGAAQRRRAFVLAIANSSQYGNNARIAPLVEQARTVLDTLFHALIRYAAPVLVDNDVNIMALGEQATAWAEVPELMFIKVATGIGAGIISNGQLQRGAQGTAGDLGHVRVPRGEDVQCRCGNTGCLEALAGGPALAAVLSREGRTASTSQDVIDLVRAGDLQAIQVVRQAGRDIGGVLATCVNLINPSVIVIGGSLAQAGEHLLAGIREVVYRRSLPLATEHLRVAPSVAGERAGVMGAAVLAIDHVLSPESIEAACAALGAS